MDFTIEELERIAQFRANMDIGWPMCNKCVTKGRFIVDIEGQFPKNNEEVFCKESRCIYSGETAPVWNLISIISQPFLILLKQITRKSSQTYKISVNRTEKIIDILSINIEDTYYGLSIPLSIFNQNTDINTVKDYSLDFISYNYSTNMRTTYCSLHNVIKNNIKLFSEDDYEYLGTLLSHFPEQTYQDLIKIRKKQTKTQINTQTNTQTNK